MNILNIIMDAGFFAAAVRLAVPLLLGTLSELTAERSGIVNLGIEGVMLSGALAGFCTASATGSLWLGVLAAILLGMLIGAFQAALVVSLRLDQTVTGLGVTMAATGLAFYSYRLGFAQSSTPPAITPFSTIPLPLLSDIPVIGQVLFNQYALTYLAYLLVPIMAFVLYRTPMGLALRSVGENPQAAASAGINPIKVRFIAMTVAGGLAALAGAYLNLAAFGSFTFGIVSGRGWICLALVVLGRWNPFACAVAALLFGGVDALQLRLQATGAVDLPYQIFLALPYAATLIAMTFNARNAVAPAALMEPYDAERR